VTGEGLPRRVLTCYRSDRPGGFALRFKRMMLALAEAGVEVHCACEQPFPLEHPRVRQHVLGSPLAGSDSLAAWAWFFFRNPPRLAKLARSLDPEAILVFAGIYSWLLSRAARSPRVPLLAFCRLRPGFSHRRSEIHIEKRGYRRADAIAAQSEATCEWIAEWAGIPRDRLHVLSNEVPAADHEPSRASAARKALLELGDLPQDALIVVYSGRLAGVKRVETLIEAVALLAGSRVRLLLIGDGPQRAWLEGKSAQLGPPGRAIFCGWRQDLADLLPGADLYVSASSLEGAPNALLEALGAGLPCLAADIPEVREVLAHDQLLFPVDDARALAERIGRASADPGYLASLRELSALRAERYAFDWDARLVDVVAQMYQQSREA
jgi:glycosyltransferase involved in cell wall biosynthesis